MALSMQQVEVGTRQGLVDLLSIEPRDLQIFIPLRVTQVRLGFSLINEGWAVEVGGRQSRAPTGFLNCCV